MNKIRRKKEKIIDISMWMGGWTFPGDKPFVVRGPYSAIGEGKEYCYNFCTNSVDGTHVQAPHYVIRNGKRINDFNISYFRREAVLINLVGTKSNFIPSNSLRNELQNIDLKEKAVIFYTGVMDRLLKGENIKDKLLSLEDAKFLLRKGVRMIITDTTCLDDPINTKGRCPTTHYCCEHEVILVKQVCNLSRVSKKQVIVEAYPLKIDGISGTPCRAVIIEED